MPEPSKIKRKIDNFLDFENLENLMDDLMQSLEKDQNFEKDKSQVFGVSIKISQDAKPIIQELAGNLKPKTKLKEKESLIDVRADSERAFVIVELPGVKKEDIDLRISGKRLFLSASSEEEFRKEVLLPFVVVEKPEKISFNNGVLEVCFLKKKAKELPGKKIKIE